jgi:hypothetical protein
MSLTISPRPGRRIGSGVALVGCLTALAVTAGAAAFRPDLFKIDLRPTSVAPSASGVALLSPARSPFGIAVNREGHVVFDVSFTASGLPRPSTLGRFDTFVAWAARDDLGEVQKLGTIKNGETLQSHVAYNKFLVIITAENGAGAAKWAGPIVLRGFAPSALLENFSGKTMFNGGMPQ